MASTIISGGTERREPRATWSGSAADLVAPLLALGLTLSAVAVIDLGLAWIPLRFGVAEWEFGTISRTFDGLALGTMGVVFLTCAAVLLNSERYLRGLAVVVFLVFALLLLAAAIYALSVTVALAAVTDETRSLMKRAVARTSSFAAIYLVLYGWLVQFLWRRAGAAKQGAGK